MIISHKLNFIIYSTRPETHEENVYLSDRARKPRAVFPWTSIQPKECRPLHAIKNYLGDRHFCTASLLQPEAMYIFYTAHALFIWIDQPCGSGAFLIVQLSVDACVSLTKSVL